MLIPNPFYAAYAAGALAADCEPVYLPATRASGFLPDLDALDDALLARTVACYLASPSNPQGAVADRAYLAKLSGLARRFGFLVFADECYCEIYSEHAPPGMLEAAGARLRQCGGVPLAVEALQPARPARRLRRRRPPLPRPLISNCATSRRRRCRCRRSTSPSPPMATRRMCKKIESFTRAKFDLADQIIGNRYGYERPAGGFFLWLDVSHYGGSEAVTKRLWAEAGVRVVPGRYLAREQADGSNPGADYIRVAMVQDKAATAEALHRLVAVLS